MNSNYEQQKDEIDLLHNILFEKLTIKKEMPNFELEIITRGNVDAPRMQFYLEIKLDDSYPNSPPIFKIEERNNYLQEKKLKALIRQINELCLESIGMPVVYQLYEAVQTFADEEEIAYINEQIKAKNKIDEEKRRYEEKLREEELKLLESKTYTPVTDEVFNQWYGDYIEEQYKQMNEKNIPGIEVRLNGREYFLNKKIKVDINEDEIETEILDKDKEKEVAVEFNPEAFEENIDDIDFDQDDIDDI